MGKFEHHHIVGRRKTFDVRVRQSHILRGRPTTASNPFCLAVKDDTPYRAARTGGYWLGLWDGKIWHLTMLPHPAKRWLNLWLQNHDVQPRTFRVHY